MKIKDLKNYISILVLLVVSLASLVTYAFLSDLSDINEIIKSIALAVFSTGLVLFVYEFIYKTRGEKYFEELIGEKIPIYLKLNEKGVEDFSNSFRISKHEEKIINSKKLTIVMNDAKSFMGHNSHIFKLRFKKTDKNETNIIILDPRSDFISFLNKKNGKDPEYYERKLLDVIKEIINNFEPSKKHKLNIYIHKMFNTMSVIIFDDIAMISLYRLSPGKSIVPHIEYKDVGEHCEYRFIQDDVEKLKSISTLVVKENYGEIKEDVFSKLKHDE